MNKKIRALLFPLSVFEEHNFRIFSSFEMNDLGTKKFNNERTDILILWFRKLLLSVRCAIISRSDPYSFRLFQLIFNVVLIVHNKSQGKIA